MADLKISQLTASTTPLDGTEVLPIVQSGATVKVANNDLRPKQIQSNATSGVLQVTGPAAASTRIATVPNANFTVARTDAAQSFTGDQTLGTGNIIQGTAAKGINFTANTPAAGMTSQLLNWYEEGTWTGTVEGTTTAGTATYSSQTGYYTRIGRQVTVMLKIAFTSHTGTGNMVINGLPFTTSANTPYPTFSFDHTAISTVPLTAQAYIQVNPSSTKLALISMLDGATGSGAALGIVTGGTFYMVATYFI